MEVKKGSAKQKELCGEGVVVFKDSTRSHQQWIGIPTQHSQTSVQHSLVKRMTAVHKTSVYLCECVTASTTHTRKHTPVLLRPGIWLCNKPTKTREDNSSVSCCPHVTITHLNVSQPPGKEGQKGSESLSVSKYFPSPFFSLFYFLPVYFIYFFMHAHRLTYSIYVNIKW